MIFTLFFALSFAGLLSCYQYDKLVEFKSPLAKSLGLFLTHACLIFAMASAYSIIKG